MIQGTVADPRAPKRVEGFQVRRWDHRGNEPDEWDRFVATHRRGTLYHRSQWGHLIRNLFGHECWNWAAVDGQGKIIGVLPMVRLKSLLFGDYKVSMPYFNYGGALGCDSSVEEALMKRAVAEAAKLGCGHVEFRDTAPRTGHWPVRTDKVVLTRQLPDTVERLWHELGSKLRSQIKRPGRERVRVATGGVNLLDDFYEVFARNMRDLGTPVYPRRFFNAIAELFPEFTTVVVVYHQERPCAAGFLLRDGKRMEIPWASSLRELNRLGINMLLYWEALQVAIREECSVFDFGRSTVGSGTFRFKQQWGATPTPLYWHYWLGRNQEVPRLNPDNRRFQFAISAWKRLPVAVTNRLGPLLVKNLP